MGCGIAEEFSRLNLKASTRLVFFHLREQARCNEDLRSACAPRVLAEDLGYSEKVIRNALRELEGLGHIKTETHSRRFTMVSFPQHSHRREGAEKGAAKGAEKGAVNESIKQRVLQTEGAEKGAAKGAEKGATGVTAVSSSSGVDVSLGSLKEIGEQPRARPPLVDKPRSTAKRRLQENYDEAIARAPRLGETTMYIDKLFAEMAGQKYPWSQHPSATTILADLLCSHGQATVMAAAEKFFVKGDQWVERKGWAIDEFGRLFAGLIAKDGIPKRTAQITADLKNQPMPTTPRDLRAQLDAMRRRQLEDMTDRRAQELAVL